MSFLIAEESSFCQEEREEKKEVLVIPYGMELNPDFLHGYEITKEGFLAALGPYIRYLEKKVGVKWKIQVFFSEEVLTHLRDGSIKLNFFRASTYLKARKELGFTPLVRAVVGSEDNYRLLVLVRKDSGIKTIKELKGKRLMTSGDKRNPHSLFMRALLSREKVVKGLNVFFGEIRRPRVYKDHSAIQALLLGEVDVTCVVDATFNVMSKLNPRVSRDLLILTQSEPFAYAPCAYSPDFIDTYGEDVLLRLKKELLRMHQTPEGDQTLLAYKVRKWIEVSDSDYDNLRQMIKDIGIEIDELFE